ncbi:MAG: LysO family transporter, partial [Bacilli bacterium]
IGYLLGTRLKKKNIKIGWTGKVQTAMLIVLLFTMGARLGANKEVIQSLGSIGVTSFILTILIFIGSVGAVYITRKLLKINSKGVRTDD